MTEAELVVGGTEIKVYKRLGQTVVEIRETNHLTIVIRKEEMKREDLTRNNRRVANDNKFYHEGER